MAKWLIFGATLLAGKKEKVVFSRFEGRESGKSLFGGYIVRGKEKGLRVRDAIYSRDDNKVSPKYKIVVYSFKDTDAAGYIVE